MNPRITKKEQGLIKGALRRVFARSELRIQVLKTNTVVHADPDRVRVTRWGWCNECGCIEAAYKLQIDHKDPVIPIDKALDDFTWDEVVDRIWCDKENLIPLCLECHRRKTKVENKERRKYKNEFKRTKSP